MCKNKYDKFISLSASELSQNYPIMNLAKRQDCLKACFNQSMKRVIRTAWQIFAVNEVIPQGAIVLIYGGTIPNSVLSLTDTADSVI